MSLTPVRGREQEDLWFPVLDAAELHDFLFAREHGHGKTVADRFAESRDIGNDIEVSLRSRKVPAKACDHFVEDQEGAVLVRQIAYLLQELICRRIDRNRLQNHSRDL